MSEKKVKQFKKNQIVITYHPDGNISIYGFPDNLDVALKHLHAAEMAVIQYFMNKPKSNLIKLNG